MVDFVMGEPIRLLPCMHFYHMRCIDNWLMRSYSCPICMVCVDVSMKDTLRQVTASSLPQTTPTTTATPSSSASNALSSPQPVPGLRRRRRDRGSSSSNGSSAPGIQGAVGHASGGPGEGASYGGPRRAEREAKRHGQESGWQFVLGYDQREHARQSSTVHTSLGVGQGREAISGQRREATSGQGREAASGQGRGATSGQVVVGATTTGHIRGHTMNYLTDRSVSKQKNSGQSTSTTGHPIGQAQVERISNEHDIEVQLLNDSGLGLHSSQDNLAYSMDQITFSDFQLGGQHYPREAGYLSSPSPVAGAVGVSGPPNNMMGVAPSPPISPPVFEYHFQYPSCQHNSQSS